MSHKCKQINVPNANEENAPLFPELKQPQSISTIEKAISFEKKFKASFEKGQEELNLFSWSKSKNNKPLFLYDNQ